MPRKSNTEWKINNNAAPHYARLIMQQEVDLKGFFEVRELRVVDSDGKSLRTFQEFHAANQWVYSELVRLAREVKSQGHDRISIHMLINVVRWGKLLGKAA